MVGRDGGGVEPNFELVHGPLALSVVTALVLALSGDALALVRRVLCAWSVEHAARSRHKCVDRLPWNCGDHTLVDFDGEPVLERSDKVAEGCSAGQLLFTLLLDEEDYREPHRVGLAPLLQYRVEFLATDAERGFAVRVA